MSRIFFDNNATTRLSDGVKEAMDEILGNPLNASSVHSYGRQARALVEKARKSVENLVGIENSRVVFTSSGTEANNLALCGFAGKVLVSAIEHVSVLKPRQDAVIINVSENGVIDLNDLDKKLAEIDGKKLVSLMFANNETGILQPVKEASEIAKKHGALLHVDAAQGFGKVSVDVSFADMVTISAHKFGGPLGAAAIVVKRSVELNPLIKGGGQEQGYRSGTENIPAIYGFGVACDSVGMLLKAAGKVNNLRSFLEIGIKNSSIDAVIIGERENRLPNTSLISMPGVSSETQLIEFDLNGIAVSAGSACSSGKIARSHVLSAMGIGDKVAGNVVRVSLGYENNEAEIISFVSFWKELFDRVNNK